jgi:UPF0148 protein
MLHIRQMSDVLRKKAAEMLLKGATLLAEPCPYCHGVRVMKDGDAMCVSCGKEPDKEKLEQAQVADKVSSDPILQTLHKKLEQLTKELESEADHTKQQQILQSINALVETIQKLKK